MKNIILFLCLMCLSSFAFANSPLLQGKKLRVCSESGYMPLEMKTSSGKWLGFDIDMMEAFSNALGVTLELSDTKWDGIIPSLLSGKCDVIASSMAITKERQGAVAFSQPYFQNEFLIAVRKSPNLQKKFSNLESFNSGQVTIAVKTGSSPDLFLQNSNKFQNAKILRFDADADVVGAVLSSKADAFIYDTPYVKLAVSHYPDKLFALSEGFHGTEFGVAFRKQDKDLLTSFNEFLARWKNDGSYQQSYNHYFSQSTWITQLSH